MAAAATKQAYSRTEICRLLKLTEKQLHSFEAQKLLPARETYGFKELLALRAIIKLRQARRPVQQIGRAVEALSAKLEHVDDPLTELKLYADGKRIRVEIEGRPMEAESGQLLLNFDQVELSRLVQFKAPDNAAAERERAAKTDALQRASAAEAAKLSAQQQLTEAAQAHDRALTQLRGDQQKALAEAEARYTKALADLREKTAPDDAVMIAVPLVLLATNFTWTRPLISVTPSDGVTVPSVVVKVTSVPSWPSEVTMMIRASAKSVLIRLTASTPSMSGMVISMVTVQ